MSSVSPPYHFLAFLMVIFSCFSSSTSFLFCGYSSFHFMHYFLSCFSSFSSPFFLFCLLTFLFYFLCLFMVAPSFLLYSLIFLFSSIFNFFFLSKNTQNHSFHPPHPSSHPPPHPPAPDTHTSGGHHRDHPQGH